MKGMYKMSEMNVSLRSCSQNTQSTKVHEQEDKPISKAESKVIDLWV